MRTLTHKTIKEAKVNLTGFSMEMEDYSEDGIVEFSGTDSGVYKLAASCEGYDTKAKYIEFDFGKKKSFTGTIKLQTDFEIVELEEKMALDLIQKAENALKEDTEIMVLIKLTIINKYNN